MCTSTVQFVLCHDRRHTLRFAELQGRYGEALRALHPELGSLESVVWVEGDDASERILFRSDVVIAVGCYLGGGWSALARIGSVVPRPWRETLYRIVARHRHRLAAPPAACFVPTADIVARFLD